MNKIISICLLFMVACSAPEINHTNKTDLKKQAKAEYNIELKVLKPEKIYLGDTVIFNYNSELSKPADSVVISIDNNRIASFTSYEYAWASSKAKVGKQKFAFTFYWADSIKQTLHKQVTLYSDIEPERYTYKVKKWWKHNTNSYTQGLEFSGEYLYEGTGQYNESMLMKIKLETGELIQSINLPNEVFGEGITLIDDKIYQLTWRSSIGYVYDKATMNKLFEFNYPSDGWGLTNNGESLIMSDGSETIYFLDKEYLTETKRIEVYDNEGPIINLNELEMINGLIYANIYQTNNIIAIDPYTGKVLKTINLSGLLKPEDIKSRIDVLNGIAWDNDKHRLLVTGKWWPKYFEIELIKQN